MIQNDSRFSLLLVDDEPRVISSLRRLLQKERYEILAAGNGQEALAVLDEKQVDFAIIDYQMPVMDGLSLLEKIRKKHTSVQTIMLTGQGGVSQAVEAIKMGALDFIEKGDKPERILAALARARKIRELEQENKRLKEQLQERNSLDAIIGRSNVMGRVKHLISQLGVTDINVLVTGESGTGKELAARALHGVSQRSKQPFVPVDCAAISESLIESELFGHERGAFTGAYNSTIGLIRSAQGGTLFLDEIGELPLRAQAKFLRVLQERSVRAVGGKKIHPVDIRVIAATNRKLEDEMSRGGFREDLYYRLNVAMIQMPPLRERASDIGLLARHFLKKTMFTDQNIKGFTKEVISILEVHKWPGNVRELENTIHRAIAVCQNEYIDTSDLPETLTGKARPQIQGSTAPGDSSLAAYERAAIINAMEICNNNKIKAASILGIGVSTLYRKLGQYKI